MSYCTAFACKYPQTHNIISHRCGCGNYGHQVGDEVLSIPKDKQCTISGCQHSESHTTSGHQCRLCADYGHSYTRCRNMKVQPCKIAELYPNSNGPVYLTQYIGMGSYLYWRREHSNCGFTYFIMDTSDWGQYGHSKVPQLQHFLRGYTPLRDIDTVTY